MSRWRGCKPDRRYRGEGRSIMRFWRITELESQSDYTHSYVNGDLDHPFGLPGVNCDVCDATWGGSRVLPFNCPDSLRSESLLQERWPISLRDHKQLQRDVRAEFLRKGVELPPLQPGDEFQPCDLDIPSQPEADFLWCSLASMVVSARVCQLFEELQVAGIEFCPVKLRKVGTRSSKLPAPMPSTGEPEDIIDEVPLARSTEGVGPYFELVVQAESGYAPRGEPVSVCGGCGRREFAKSSVRFRTVESMWKGADVFFLAGTLYIVVTERIRSALLEIGATNVQFKPC